MQSSASRSLTVREAKERAAVLRVAAMTVELDLDRGDPTYGSRTTLEVEALTATDTFVNVQPQRLNSIDLDGSPLDPDLLAAGRFPLRLEAGRHSLVVEADMAYSHDGEGLHRTVDPADGLVYTHLMSFLDAAPRCFACFDQPDLKAPYRVRVSAPAEWTIVGNGRATRVGNAGDSVQWELAETLPLSTYLITLVAGPYHSRLAEHDGIRLGVHAKQSLAAALDKEFDEIVEVTSQAFDGFHRMFGIRYPFGDYHQAFVPEFNAGAMENPGCVTFRDSMIFRGPVPDGERGDRARTIVHEMAHMWFGDLVTMRWWDDLWLNESFAEYMGHRVSDEQTRFTDSWVDFVNHRKRWGMVADQLPSSHPVAGNGAADAQVALQNFDGISYSKGAAVLKQLAAYLGDDVFLAGVRDHLERHAYANATLADLLASWERAAGHDLDSWAQSWLCEAGVDTLRVDGDTLVRSAPAGAARSARPHEFVLHRIAAGGGVETAPVSVASDRTQLPLAPSPGQLLVPDARDDTWAKIRYDEQTLALLPERLAAVTDPVTRGAVWLALRDAVDDAELDPAFVLGLLEAGLETEDQDNAVDMFARWGTRHLLGRILGGDSRSSARVAAAFAGRLRSAPPSGGVQLAAARGLVSVSGDVDLLRAWLADDVPGGLIVDADLRWRTLSQLCRLGAATTDEIDAEFTRDRSNEGEVYAARCRASLPQPDTKAAAWELMTRDGNVSNHVLDATCEGFWWPEQQPALEAYVPRYFSELPATVSLRQGWVVADSLRQAFPRFAVAPATLQLADTLLAKPDLDGSVRRAIVDETDGLRRSLAIRTRWLA